MISSLTDQTDQSGEIISPFPIAVLFRHRHFLPFTVSAAVQILFNQFCYLLIPAIKSLAEIPVIITL